MLLFILATSRYQKEEIRKTAEEIQDSERTLFCLYPSSLFIIHNICRLKIGEKFYQKVYTSIQCIHAREDAKKKTNLYLCKQISIILFLTICITILSILIGLSKTSQIQHSYYVKRPYYGEEETKVALNIDMDNIKKEVEIKLQERHYTKEENIEHIMMQAMQYLDEMVIGENDSYEHVTKQLSLIRKIPDLQVMVSWDFDKKGIVSSDGKITISEEATEGEVITMTATLSYYDTKKLYPINIVIFPEEKTKEERLLLQLEEEIYNRQVKNPESEYLELPNAIDNQRLTYSEYQRKDDYILNLLGVVAVICIGVSGYSQMKKEKKKREMQMLLDYPEVINKLVLLVGAGMTIKNAWGKMSLEYEARCKKELKEGNGKKRNLSKTRAVQKRYVYEEMMIAYSEIQNGIAETEAYDRFGRRIQLIPYMKLSSLLVQNVKKGTADLLQLLEYEAIQAFEERKEVAKRLGEEAGTKLLGPMVLMLLIVLMVIMLPAFMQM
ncbi:immunoglobulin-like domain-containing protein [Anaerosporobacter sp.]|uniref:immunoglobulin-like domain-containing protein n=1 Tax=Anaerosporobacter sp. TaxID=1872529 RepID=UPI00286F4B47|nr:immunoglobulin-like domain-containing protein [Anaerosporobacter sp.]